MATGAGGACGGRTINTGRWKRGSGAFRQASPQSPAAAAAAAVSQCDITLCDVIAPGCWREIVGREREREREGAGTGTRKTLEMLMRAWRL